LHTSLFLRSFDYNFVYEFVVLHYESNLIGLDQFDVGVSIQVCCRYSCRFMPFQDLLISIMGLVRWHGSFPRFCWWSQYVLLLSFRTKYHFWLLNWIYARHWCIQSTIHRKRCCTVKFKAKFWIDVVGQRVAKAVGSAINN
jgi:hypothetical protein